MYSLHFYMYLIVLTALAPIDCRTLLLQGQRRDFPIALEIFHTTKISIVVILASRTERLGSGD